MENLMIEIMRNPIYLPILLIWSLVWKGICLWKSAKENQKGWFIAFLFLNTLGFMEICYLIYYRKGKNNFYDEDKNLIDALEETYTK